MNHALRTCGRLFVSFAFCLAIAVPKLAAQESANTLPATRASTTAVPDKAQPQPVRDAYWTRHDQQLLVDFGDLAYFKTANAALPPVTPSEDRVVFMGDSITHGWQLDSMFPGKPYINRGISGQTTPQMLVRFRQDVIDLHPKVVVILGGTNDIAENTGPMTLEQTENDLASMADLAAANQIRVVLCSVTPSVDFPWHKGLAPATKIAALNDWIRQYAAKKGYVFVDFYSALKDEQGGLPATLSRDGVHPNLAGYSRMAPLAQAGIAKALAR